MSNSISIFDLNKAFLRKRQVIDPVTCQLTTQEFYRVGPFYTLNQHISVQSLFLLSKIAPLFDPDITGSAKLLHIVHQLNSKKFGVSLRMLDWLLTNYAKEFNAGIKHGNKQVTGIFTQYKIAMKEYRRDLFDVFRRLNETRRIVKIYYDIPTKEGVKTCFTTVGQLNFVQWAYRHRILQFAQDNIKSIEAHQTSNSRSSNKRKKAGTSKKRSALIREPMQQCVIYSDGVTVNFV